jgi:hypothetical protein
MTYPSHISSVPLFHSLESGTVEQDQELRNTQRNVYGTSPLKALATKLLERNNDVNKSGTVTSKSVPPTPQCSTACGTRIEVGCKVDRDDLLYEFNERVAIAEYDGGQTDIQAQRMAYLDAFISVLSTLPATDLQRDWLNQRIQTTLAWIEGQKFPTLN